MSEPGHLPECEPDLQLSDGSFIACICDRLRSCEARVRDEDAVLCRAIRDVAIAKAIAETEQRTREDDNRALWDNRQWDAALDAARDAVAAAVTHRGGYHSAAEFTTLALAAIDALKEK